MVGCDYGVGMAVKGHNQSQAVVLSCVCQRLSDDLLVTEMHAIKNTNRKADLAASGLQIGSFADELHATYNLRFVMFVQVRQ